MPGLSSTPRDARLFMLVHALLIAVRIGLQLRYDPPTGQKNTAKQKAEFYLVLRKMKF